MLASQEAITQAKTVVVVAHPDDEVLWFASVLPRADNVILAFGPYREVPKIAAARDRAVSQLPFPTTFLRLDEAGSYLKADWTRPGGSPTGMILDQASPAVRKAYESNFRDVRDRLRSLLRPGQTVFSHNPWGEYGHEDHVLVFRAVESLRRELGFEQWVSPYVSDRSALLAEQWTMRLNDRSASATIDARFAASIEAIYQKHRCWTWQAEWVWPTEEWFYRMSEDSLAPQSAHETPLIRVVRS